MIGKAIIRDVVRDLEGSEKGKKKRALPYLLILFVLLLAFFFRESLLGLWR